MECIICGKWFSSTDETEKVCMTCGRVLQHPNIGIASERLLELAQAERDGRLVVLPCKNDLVYTIEENCFECDQCKYGDQAKYDPNINRRCCDLDAHPSRNCPLEIKENGVSGFYISFDKNGNPILSNPGEYGYEGLETFIGIDGKFYFTREEAEAALKKREESTDD